MTDSYPFLTPYQYASCDPITNIDIDGLEGCPSVCGMTGYIGKVGSSLGRGAGILQGVSKVGPLINTLNAGLNIANTSTQRNIVKQQIANNRINGPFTNGQVGRTMPAVDNTKVKHYYDNRSGSTDVTEFDLPNTLDITDKVRDYSEKIGGIIGKDKLEKHLEKLGRIYIVGSALDNLLNKEWGELIEKGVDWVFRNNAYYFFIKNVVTSKFVGNQALTELYFEFTNAQNSAIQASDKLRQAKRSSIRDDIKYWEDELKQRNGKTIEIEKQIDNFLKFQHRERPFNPEKSQVKSSDGY